MLLVSRVLSMVLLSDLLLLSLVSVILRRKASSFVTGADTGADADAKLAPLADTVTDSILLFSQQIVFKYPRIISVSLSEFCSVFFSTVNNLKCPVQSPLPMLNSEEVSNTIFERYC
jgi:hypothetical protein